MSEYIETYQNPKWYYFNNNSFCFEYDSYLFK